MIHGHAFIKGTPTTEHYYVCGDLREFDDVQKIIGSTNYGVINLKNHGFLIYSNDLLVLKNIIEGCDFYYEREQLVYECENKE